jgi:hypothetical protein
MRMNTDKKTSSKRHPVNVPLNLVKKQNTLKIKKNEQNSPLLSYVTDWYFSRLRFTLTSLFITAALPQHSSDKLKTELQSTPQCIHEEDTSLNGPAINPHKRNIRPVRNLLRLFLLMNQWVTVCGQTHCILCDRRHDPGSFGRRTIKKHDLTFGVK